MLFQKLLLPAVLLTVFGFGASAQQNETFLDIRLKGLKKGDTLYLLSTGTNRRTDTLIATRNGRIDATLAVGSTQESILYYLPEGKKQEDIPNSQVRPLLLQPGECLSIKGRLTEIGQASITGGVYSRHPYKGYLDSLEANYRKANVFLDSMSVIERAMNATPENDKRQAMFQHLRQLNDQAGAVTQQRYRLMESFVRSYPDDPFSAYVLNGIKGSKSLAVIRELYSLLGEKALASPAGKEITDRLSIQRAWEQANDQVKAGSPAPAFTLTDIDGRTISLSDFRGRYLVLDFWGSWCGPCRDANPHRVELYQRYKDRPDFAILSLALDKDDAAWRKAVQDDGLCWPQVNMSQTPESPASVNVLYGINLYPTQMLVSPDGEILVRQGGFDARKNLVAERLSEIFGE